MQVSIISAFHAKLRSVNSARIRCESLLNLNSLRVADVEILYEGLFLRQVVEFEATLENLFFAVICDKTSYAKRRVRPKLAFVSKQYALEVLLQGKEYLDWLPINNTLDRAKRVLRAGRPFTVIGPGDKSRLKEIHLIRNAIAHSSGSARAKFRSKVIGNSNLLPRERTPAGFLRSRTNETTTRFEVYSAILAQVTEKMKQCRPRDDQI